MQNKKISVMGCGWLGFPLALELVRQGLSLKGSTTTPEKLDTLQQSGIEPFFISFPEKASKTELQKFLDADVVVFNLPPSKASSEAASYEFLLKTVLEAMPASVSAFLFVSSTSVYPDLNRAVIEQDAIASPTSESLMLRCEYLVQQAMGEKATIVRFGGLMSRSRHPGRFMAGKTDVPQPKAPVNMIHLNDCVELLSEIIIQEKWGFTFNACAPEHPGRQEFYTEASRVFNQLPPVFRQEETLRFKKINSNLLQSELSFKFMFPDPLSALSSSDF